MRDVYEVWDCVSDIDGNTTFVSVSVPVANRIDWNEQFISEIVPSNHFSQE